MEKNLWKNIYRDKEDVIYVCVCVCVCVCMRARVHAQSLRGVKLFAAPR